MEKEDIKNEKERAAYDEGFEDGIEEGSFEINDNDLKFIFETICSNCPIGALLLYDGFTHCMTCAAEDYKGHCGIAALRYMRNQLS